MSVDGNVPIDAGIDFEMQVDLANKQAGELFRAYLESRDSDPEEKIAAARTAYVNAAAVLRALQHPKHDIVVKGA